MKVKELMKKLEGYEDYEFAVSCDEEFNTIFGKWEVVNITGRKKTLVIFGLSGTELIR